MNDATNQIKAYAAPSATSPLSPTTIPRRQFCGEHDIIADVEVIAAEKINEAYERLLKADVKYRFSTDMATI